MSPRRRNTLLAVVAGLAVALALAAWLLDIDFSWNAPAGWIRAFLHANGQAAAVLLLYLEESGIPMPVPGDFFVMYLGHRVSNSLLFSLLAWVVLTAAVVGGATNLYWISRRWGQRIVSGRFGAMVHVTPERVARAERWFTRWGPWALIIGRHIPGCRIPITVAAGTFRTSYRTFAVCVAISTATWAGFFLVLGNVLGERAQMFIDGHQTATPVIFAGIVAGAALYLVARFYLTRHHEVASAEH